MPAYYVNPNTQSNGDNEVHKEGCYWLGLVANPVFLGYHTECTWAVDAAKARGYFANGCYHCSTMCHTT